MGEERGNRRFIGPGLRTGVGADSQPISTAQPKAPSPPRILLGQQLFAAQWHQHSTVQEGGTTATLIPGAHAGDTACGDSQSLNLFLIFQIHLFPLGKKKTQSSKSKDKSAPWRGEAGRSKQDSGTKILQICNAKPCIANTL